VQYQPADLVLLNARVWTLDEARPEAEAVAIRGNRLVRVGTNEEVKGLVGEGVTRILNLRGRLVLPGFIDNHTHFEAAGRLLLGLNLLDVNERAAFVARVREVANRLPKGSWITGGDWGAYAQWQRGAAAASRAPVALLEPHKKWIDEVTPEHPALIRRFDGEVWLANSLALAAAGITRATPDPPGGEIVRDAGGEPTGLLRGEASKLVEQVIPPPPHAQRLAEGRRALEEARRWGVTSIHDNTSFEQLEVFKELRKRGELTLRVWARMPLAEWQRLKDYIRLNRVPAGQGVPAGKSGAGWGDQYIRLAGLKGWVDGIMGNSTALFFEPYDHQPGNTGRLRDIMFPEGNLERLVREADREGFTVTVHAIGDRANRILLDIYQKIIEENPPRDRRFRVVHAQVVHGDDFQRFGELKLIAEVQPYHCIDDMRWMEERIGPERARGAYAFRTLGAAGATLSFGSDWPGTNASLYPINPLLGIYAAVTRQTLRGEPAAGWFPEQRVTLEEAIRAFTRNNAYASFEESLKGSISEGKLADLVVLDRDILSAPPQELLATRVLYTIFGGKIVYEGK
jgi:predicted amidohydrolase YtcJ